MSGVPCRATVVVPLLNHRPFVERQLLSIVEQWRPDLELLVVDDGSQDGGFGAVQSCLAAHPEVRATLVRHDRSHGAALPARVLGLASADIIIQADSDDVMLPGRIAETLQCFADDPACHLVTSNALMLSPEGIALGIHDTLQPDAVLTDALPAAGQVGDTRWLGATAAFRRAVYEAFPPLDQQSCSPMIDLLTPFRALLLGSHHYLARPLVGWRQHPGNTHRTLGVFDEEGPRLERYKFYELTILAQKLRDAQEMLLRTPGDGRLQAVVARCNEFFFTAFTAWSRLRLSLGPAQDTGPRPGGYVSALPPMPTLSAHALIDFAAGSVGARVAAASSGFHEPEPWGVWTQRHALLNFRLVNPALTVLVLSLRPLPGHARHALRLLVLGGGWTEHQVGADSTELALPIPAGTAASGTLTLVISTPAACIPADALPGQQDIRLLGVGIARLACR